MRTNSEPKLEEFMKNQIDRIMASLKTTKPHMSGNKKPNMSQQEKGE